MSTRSQLRFIQRSETAGEQSDTDRIAQIYRHSDGSSNGFRVGSSTT